MIIEKLEMLCVERGITITSLCKEITGSSGNLPTWRKGNIKPTWLKKICLKFNISSDFLLDLPRFSLPENLKGAKEEQDLLIRYYRLLPDNRIMAQSRMIELYEKQKNDITVQSENGSGNRNSDIDSHPLGGADTT